MPNNKPTVNSEKGIILIACLMLISIIALLEVVAAITTTTDMLITNNFKTSVKTFYIAETGKEEGRARLRANSANLISDTSDEANADWKEYIGSSDNAQALMTDPYDPNLEGIDHFLNPSIIPTSTYALTDEVATYTVVIKHATDAGGSVLYWGDNDGDGDSERHTNSANGKNIYTVTSYASYSNGNKAVETEMAKVPPITVPAALYVEGGMTTTGLVELDGEDACGSSDKHGLATTLLENEDALINNGGVAEISSVEYNTTELDIETIIDTYKSSADFTYSVDDDTLPANGNLSPTEDWGTPINGDHNQIPPVPYECTDSNIIYIDSRGTTPTAGKTKLTGESGCGILLVEGDLDIQGGFNWYGLIIIKGALTFAGGGGEFITGSVLSGGALDNTAGGGTSIIYCSTAMSETTENMPLITLSWEEK